jgi:hypothetical protein
MRLFVLLFFLMAIDAQAQAGTPLQIELSSTQKLIASVITPDNHFFAAIGDKDKVNPSSYNLKGKLTLLHYDANRSLVSKVMVKSPKLGKQYFEIISMIAIGDTVGLIAQAEDYSNSTVTTSLLVLDKKSLTIGTEIFDLHSHPFGLFMSLGRNERFEFKQYLPGSEATILIEYEEAEKEADGTYNITSKFQFLLLKRNLRIKNIQSFSERDDRRRYEICDYFTSPDLQIYIHLAEQKDFEGDFREESELLEYLANEVSVHFIYVFNSNLEENKFQIRFADSSYEPSNTIFFAAENDVYLGGKASNADNNYRKLLKGDTAVDLDDYTVTFFVAKVNNVKSNIIVQEGNLIPIDGNTKEKLLGKENVSKEDREMGARPGLILMAITKEANGSFRFAGALYSIYIYPEYASIKNDKKYKFTKDDRGVITEVEGQIDNHFEYHHLFVAQVDLISDTMKISTIGFTGRESFGYNSESTGRLDEVRFRFSADGTPQFHYRKNGAPSELVYWQGSNSSVKLNFEPASEFVIVPTNYYATSTTPLIITERDKIWIVPIESKE